MPKYTVNPDLPRFQGIVIDGVVYKRGDEVTMSKKKADLFGKHAGVPRLVAATVTESPDPSDNDGNDTERES